MALSTAAGRKSAAGASDGRLGKNGPGSYKRRKRNDYKQDATPNSN